MRKDHQRSGARRFESSPGRRGDNGPLTRGESSHTHPAISSALRPRPSRFSVRAPSASLTAPRQPQAGACGSRASAAIPNEKTSSAAVVTARTTRRPTDQKERTEDDLHHRSAGQDDIHHGVRRRSAGLQPGKPTEQVAQAVEGRRRRIGLEQRRAEEEQAEEGCADRATKSARRLGRIRISHWRRPMQRSKLRSADAAELQRVCIRVDHRVRMVRQIPYIRVRVEIEDEHRG